MDTRALNHVLTHSDNYYKPEVSRVELGRILGHGLLVVEGETIFFRESTFELICQARNIGSNVV